ncbi:MAG: hypothetical protein ACLPN6_26265 [Streptosporangiaceae bacterium]|jgi:hypothetical protein
MSRPPCSFSFGVLAVVPDVPLAERPTALTAWSPFTATSVRKLARSNGASAAKR